MEGNNKIVALTSSTSFIGEIMLVLMGLSGISVVGVTIGYFHSLSILFISSGFSIGILSIIICVIGIYVLWSHSYYRLKLFLSFLFLFVGLQLSFLIYLYYITNNIDMNEKQQGLIISLDVCCGLSGSALIAVFSHLKRKGSNIGMVKL